MAQLHLVFGPQGAGKTTYSRRLAEEVRGVRFSIDEWMGALFGPDLPQPLNFGWIMERVARCEQRIWTTTLEVARSGVDVVLDLGFMKLEHRGQFAARAEEAELTVQTHFVDAPYELRRGRVLSRNREQGATFAFEVTPQMFDFMEQQFEKPSESELARARVSYSQ